MGLPILQIFGWGESGKVILQVIIAVFRALSKNFSGKDGSAPPLQKLAHTPMILMMTKIVLFGCNCYGCFTVVAMQLKFTELELWSHAMCIVLLQIALRWRIEAEVVAGKGRNCLSLLKFTFIRLVDWLIDWLIDWLRCWSPLPGG